MSDEVLPNATPSASSPPPLTCDEAGRLIDCLVEEGNLLSAERALLMAHVNRCSGCRGNLEHRRQLDARLREAFAGLDTGPGFTERLLALLPVREAGISSAWRKASVRVSGRKSAAPDGTRTGGSSAFASRTWTIPLALVAVLAFVVGLWRFWRDTPVPVPPFLVVSRAENLCLERDRRFLDLSKGLELRAGDALKVQPQSGANAGSCNLVTAQGAEYCAIRLAAGARLLVQARGQYQLVQGEAYFEVDPDRPGAGDERFEVETFCGRVEVLGTSFGVIVPSPQANTVTVVVDRGTVRLCPLSGPRRDVDAGLECDLNRNGGTGEPQSILAGRMPFLRALATVADTATPSGGTLPQTGPIEPVKPLPGHVDWSAAVTDLDFGRASLSKAFQMLQQRMGTAEEWPALIEQAAKLAPEGTSSLSIRRPVAAGAVVRWLARERELRFVPPSRLRPAAGAEPLGEVQDGELPAGYAAYLDAQADVPEEGLSGAQMLRLLAERTGFAVLVDAQARLPQIPRRPTWRALLEQLAASSDTDWAWYDGLLYLGPRRQIETLTLVPRSEELTSWLGPQPLPVWERSLKQLLSQLSVDREGHLTLNPERPLLSAVALYPDDRGVRYTAGVRGTRTVAALRALLQEGSAAVADPVAVLNEFEANGRYGELGDLVAQAARHTNVVYEGERREFPMQSFVVRRMPLGRALERGAWLHGLGLRIEPGRIVVGSRAACYGGPVLNAILLTAAARRCPRVALQLPETLARQAQASFPERLRGVEWLPLREALVFCGDASQLAAVQAVACEMERAIAADPDAFDPQTWTPPWRRELEANLNEPFRGDESGMLPAGSFLGVLRSGLFFPLKADVLVDPSAMKELASRQLPALDVRGQTMRQALQTLAQSAGLRVIVEDGTIWLRP